MSEASDKSGTDNTIIDTIKLLEQFEHSDEVDFPLYKENTKLLFEQLLRKLEENDSRIFDLEQRLQGLEAEVDVKDLELERASVDMQAMQEAVNDCRCEADAMVEEMLAKIAIEVNQRRAVERAMYKIVAENEKLKSLFEYSKLRSLVSKFGYEANWETLCVTQQQQLEAQSASLAAAEAELSMLKKQRGLEMHAVGMAIAAMHSKIKQLSSRPPLAAAATPSKTVQHVTPKKCREVHVTAEDTLPSELHNKPATPSVTKGAAKPNTPATPQSSCSPAEKQSPGKELVQSSRQIWSSFTFKA